MSFIFSIHSSTTPRREKVSDWAGCEKKSIVPCLAAQDSEDWKDVSSSIKQMDQSYDATFYAWLKSEENVLVTSIYLHRIANEYSLERISNALKWLTSDWRWESTSILVRHVTVDWCDDEGDVKRAKLLTDLTSHWATHYVATFITTILISAPYTLCSKKRERFLKEFTKDWDFSKLSEFFMFLRSRANIDYKFKCMMLQKAARKDHHQHVPTATSNTQQHRHRRTSSNEFPAEMKRTLSSSDATTAATNTTAEFGNGGSLSTRCYYNDDASSSSSSAASSSSANRHTATQLNTSLLTKKQ